MQFQNKKCNLQSEDQDTNGSLFIFEVSNNRLHSACNNKLGMSKQVTWVI
ncbi:hypothetical protein N480_10525 [Pseudoalteromonas luteoviolacea S2607]|nr:hypothetical protein N480_10525 [Pseudoalteromonas luteoviolacea S2607]